MKRTFKIAAIVMALSTATAAVAAVDTNRLIADFEAQGYSNVQVTNHGGEVEVVAMAGTQQMTFVYDANSGVLLRREGGTALNGNGIGAASADVTGDIAPGTNVGGHDSDDSGVGNDDSGNDDSGNDDSGNDDSGNDDSGNDDSGNDGNDD